MRGEGTGSELTCGATCRWSNVSRPTIRFARCRPWSHDLERTVAQFDQLYSKVGRPSIRPSTLLRALLLQVLYSARSERLLMEQLDYNLLFRWFVGLAMDDPIWDATVFTKNRERLLARRKSRAPFSSGSAPRPSSGACCPTSTSRSTAP